MSDLKAYVFADKAIFFDTIDLVFTEESLAELVKLHGPVIPPSQWTAQDRTRIADPEHASGIKTYWERNRGIGPICMLHPHSLE